MKKSLSTKLKLLIICFSLIGIFIGSANAKTYFYFQKIEGLVNAPIIYPFDGTTGGGTENPSINISISSPNTVALSEDETDMRFSVNIHSTNTTDWTGANLEFSFDNSTTIIDSITKSGSEDSWTLNVSRELLNPNGELDVTLTASLPDATSVNKTISVLVGEQTYTCNTTNPFIGMEKSGSIYLIGDIAGNPLNAEAQLLCLSQNQISTVRSASYKMTANVSFSANQDWCDGKTGCVNDQGWIPLNSFSSTFDGGEFEISGLYINRPTVDNQGFLGYFEGSVRNLGIVASSVKGKSNVGGIIGDYSYSSHRTLSNCYYDGIVEGSEDYVGGLIGNGYSSSGYRRTISNSYATGNVSGASSVGGLMGRSYTSTITDSYSKNNVTGTGSYTGGISGRVNGSSILLNVFSEGTITGKGYLGGVFGLHKGTITNAYFNGTIVGGTTYVGGIAGSADNITNAYNEGDISGSGTSWIGGIVGSLSGNISNAYYSGNINTPSASNIGGLGGYIKGDITNSYATGSVKGIANIGGLAGLYNNTAHRTINNSYYNGDVEGAGDYVGGLFGDGYNSSGYGRIISNSYALGSVKGVSSVGGLMGRSYTSTITDSYTKSDVTGTSNYTGGIGGRVTGTSSISGTFSEGTITGKSYLGGIIGLHKGTITNTYFKGSLVGGITYVGGIAGSATTISNIYSEVDIDSSGTSWIGGIVGSLSGNISNAYYSGNINTPSASNIGGLGGYIQGDITNSYAKGSVKGIANIGGLAGLYNYAAHKTINNSYYSGDVEGSGDYVGGLFGDGYNSSGYGRIISNSYALGSVKGDVYVGGLMGRAYTSTITDSYTKSNITGTGNYTGGIGGRVIGTSSISETFSEGTITGKSYLGGIIGSHKGSITNAYFKGSLVGGITYVGGIAGLADTISNVYYEGDINGSGTSRIGGIVGSLSGNISNAYYSGNINTPSASNIGGVAGYIQGNITNSYATGSVKGIDNIGGLAGLYNYATHRTISNSYYNGDVEGSGNYVGGLLGDGYNSSGYRRAISNSYATGSVKGVSSVGGLMGRVYTTTTNDSYAKNTVTGTGSYIAGIVGKNSGALSMTDTYYIGNLANIKTGSGTVTNKNGLCESSSCTNTDAKIINNEWTSTIWTGLNTSDEPELTNQPHSFWTAGVWDLSGNKTIILQDPTELWTSSNWDLSGTSPKLINIPTSIWEQSDWDFTGESPILSSGPQDSWDTATIWDVTVTPPAFQ